MTRSVDNLGVGSVYATFDIDTTGSDYDLTTANEGEAVALSGNNETDRGADDDPLLGQLISVQTDIAVVQVAGVMRVPFSGTTPSVGDAVAVDGAGNVKTASGGRGLVIAVDAGAGTVDLLL
jgi:hypothetical protein